MKKFILIFLLAVIGLTANSYGQYNNGSIADSSNLGITPSGFFDAVFDHYGNKYNLYDIKIDSVKTGIEGTLKSTNLLCTSGYFNLYFETGSGMEGNGASDIARRSVVCQVFSDISAFINSPLTSTGNKVNIWIRDINQIVQNSSTSGVLGLASAFYNLPSSSTSGFGGIADNEVWKTIHSGIDSYTNVTSPIISTGGQVTTGVTFYHGMAAFNFNNPSINWNTNLTIANSPTGLYDLYSVVIHEVTHALGFASLINYNGLSKFGPSYNYYSRYDLKLKNNALTQNLITNSGSCSLYNYHFNTSLNSSIIYPGCTNTPPTNSGSLDNTICSNAIIYSGLTTVPVYTPTCFEPPSSLSHFEDQCYPTGAPYGNNIYFTMSNANGSGATYTKRYLKPEERLVLCDIGYNTNTTFGNTANNNFYNYNTTSCAGINVAGINDGIISTGANAGSYAFIGNASANITISGILNNDYNATSFECLQDIYYPATTLSATSGTTTTNIVFNSSVIGNHLLRYIPVSSNGQRGNITYIYVYVKELSCTPSVCNMINNGNFENITEISSIVYWNQGRKFDCWQSFTNSPDVFSRNFQDLKFNIPTIWSNPPSNTWNAGNTGTPTNDHFAGFGSLSTVSGKYCESLQTLLNSPITPNNTYTINFWVKYSNNSGFYSFAPICQQPTLLIGGSTNMLVPLGSAYQSTQIPSSVSVLNSISIPTDNSWHYISQQFTYNGTINLNNLIVMDNSTMFLSSSVAYIYVDDISLLPSNEVVTINYPSSLCLNQTLPDLSVYLPPSIPNNGTFAGNGVANISGIYSFNPTVAGIGNQIITYTFTNSLGCNVTVYGTINVLPLHVTIPVITGPNPTCLNSSQIYTTQDNMTNYIWTVTGGTITSGIGTNTITVTWNTLGNQSVSVIFTDGPCTITIPTIYNVTVNYTGNIQTPIITGNHNNCDLTTTYTIDNPVSNSVYTWAITTTSPTWAGNIVSVQGIPTITVNWNTIDNLNPGVLTVISNENGCTSTSSITIYNCCGSEHPRDFTLHGNPYNINSPTDLSNDYITIDGTVNINCDITLSHQLISFGPNAKIVVSPGVTFKIDNESFLVAGCNFMWEGIFISDPTAKVEVIGNSTIRDAINGIVSDIGGKFTLRDANMENNLYNVRVHNYSDQNPHTGSIRNTRFVGPIYLSYPPYAGQKTICGIESSWINGVLNIGDETNAANLNTFQNMRFGIYAINSNLSIVNNKFLNIENGAYTSGQTQKYYPEGAIYAQYAASTTNPYNNITVGGDGLKRNYFDNCKTGIYTYQYFNTIEYNDIKNTGIGIQSLNISSGSRYKHNIIYDNLGNGVSAGYGIDIRNSHSDLIQRGIACLVDSNDVINKRIGISLLGISGTQRDDRLVEVKHNIINYTLNVSPLSEFYIPTPANAKHIGIWVQNSHYSQTKLNTIIRNYPVLGSLGEDSTVLGIRIAESRGASVFQNNIMRMGSGVYTNGLLTNTQFNCNILYYNHYGFRFGFASGISDQGSATSPKYNPNNQWDDFNPQAGHERMYDDFGLVNILNYYYDPNYGWSYDPLIMNFTIIPVQNLDVTSFCINQTGPLGTDPDIKDKLDAREAAYGQIIRNERFYSYLEDEYKLKDREYVYEMLRSYPELINLGGEDDNLYLQFYNDCFQSDIENVLKVREEMYAQNLEAARAKLAQIADDSTINTNRKIVDGIYFDTWAQDNFELNDEQVSTLRRIALLTPYAGGDAVYTARVMLNINPDEIAGLDYARPPVHFPVQTKEITASVFPNPAKDRINILFNDAITADAIIEIYGNMGNKILTEHIQQGSINKTIDIGKVRAGLYFYTITLNGGKISSGKITIVNK
ncbi:MAG: T9SS type A sorting domain-containing protein [Bacteroidales bacterium]